MKQYEIYNKEYPFLRVNAEFGSYFNQLYLQEEMQRLITQVFLKTQQWHRTMCF